MCLAVPGKLIEIAEDNGLKMGRVDYSGTVQTACLAYVPDVEIGQYVLVHAGFALTIIDEAEAHRTLALWDELMKLTAGEGTDPLGFSPDEPNEAEADPSS